MPTKFIFLDKFCLIRQIHADLKARSFDEVSDKVRLACSHFARSLVEVWFDKSVYFFPLTKFARSLLEVCKGKFEVCKGKKSKFARGKVEVTNGPRPIALSLAPERLLTRESKIKKMQV